MEERENKTIMCSVLFLDIVEYSKKSVAGQISLKDRFNNYLSYAIRDVPIADRIILDTGDGAAINFLGDVEDALKAALSLRESLLNEDVSENNPLLVRMGINLGPVRLVRDINGQPNIVGDGINVAQRVMGFADAAQILVSRSYFDAVSRLSPQYAGMFHYQGSRTDKHVREHEIFAIGQPGEITAARQGTAGKGGGQAARDVFRNASAKQRALFFAALAGTLLLIIVVSVKFKYRASAPSKQAAVAPAMEAAQATSAVAAAPVKITETVSEKKPKPEIKKPKHVSPDHEKPAKQTSSVRTLDQTAGVEARAEAMVSIAVTPWGEVYLDGRMQGVSPPLAELHVTPGKHEIEIRNTTFKAYTQSIHVKAGEKIKIKHKFAN